MKMTLLIAAALFSVQLAWAKSHTMEVKWTDETTAYEGQMSDGDVLTLKFPWKNGSKPRAEIAEETLARCRLLGVKRVKQTIQVKVQLEETVGDDGFNGCMVYVERNHKDDEEGDGTVYVDFGTFIDG